MQARDAASATRRRSASRAQALHRCSERIVYELRGIPCIELEEGTPENTTIIASRSFGWPVVSQHDLEQVVSVFILVQPRRCGVRSLSAPTSAQRTATVCQDNLTCNVRKIRGSSTPVIPPPTVAPAMPNEAILCGSSENRKPRNRSSEGMPSHFRLRTNRIDQGIAEVIISTVAD